MQDEVDHGTYPTNRRRRAEPTWKYRILHGFAPAKNGSTPVGGVTFGPDGALYGTTSAGGQHESGVAFRLTLSGSYTVLQHFAGNYTSGPQGELIVGQDEALYGTTFGGGKYNEGTIFRLTVSGDHTVLYNLKGVNQPGGSQDGAQPEGKLAFGKDGTLYGTTAFGGSPSGYGTAWSLKPPGVGGTKWTYTQLHIFGSSGNLPHAGVVITGGGALYGTAAGGGRWQDGVVYKLAPPSAGGTEWTYSVLHSFQGSDKDGNIPWSGFLKAGTIYGTNLSGGAFNSNCINGCGTVFKLTP